MRILIVEDSPSDSDLLKFHLEAQGHEVVAAADAAEAMRIIRHRNKFGLVISDFAVPAVVGNEFILFLQHFGYRTCVFTGRPVESVGDVGEAEVFCKGDIQRLLEYVAKQSMPNA